MAHNLALVSSSTLPITLDSGKMTSLFKEVEPVVNNSLIVADSIEKYRILDAHNDRVAPIWRPLSRLNSDGFDINRRV